MTTPASRPLQVAYDIARLSAGGANGGIKIHHYEFLRRFVNEHSHEVTLHVFCSEAILPELGFLSNEGFHQIHVLGARSAYEPRNGDGSLPVLRYWPEPPKDLLSLLEIDVLYAGFGFSQVYTPKVPQVSLIVDVLHRSYPDSLPEPEVAFRDRWYPEAIQRSVLVQTNSQFCKQQLVNEFGADPDKIVTVSLPLHGRFNEVEMGLLPSPISHLPHQYFLYPANYWPHKNHQRLIEAYALYYEKAGDAALHLVLTGELDHGGQKTLAQIKTLGLGSHVHAIGHQDLPTYKAVWELAHSLVFPSRYEGFGLPLLEALYFQKPVLCSEAAYANEFLAPKALKVDTTDSSVLAKALAELQAQPDKYLDTEATLSKFDAIDEAQNVLEHWKQAANPNRKADATNA